MKKKRIGLKFVTKLVIAVAALITIGGATLSYALIDETNSVHIKASEIEDATLIIGTHLIYLGSMNDQIYETAMKSAEESNQYSRYYKSEIAGGVWYEITEAGALADITTDGIVADNRVIEALFMTHHTKSDGITYDLRTGAPVGIFDINSPYDLTKMAELEPIKLQYDVLAQTAEPSDTVERDILNIKELYKYDRQTDKTKEIDAQLNALQTYYDILIRDEAEEAASQMVMSVMEKVDAARRAEVLGPLNDIQLQKMSLVVGREFTYLAGEITEMAGTDLSKGRTGIEKFVPNSDLLTAISESMTNVQESYINYSSKMLAEGNTILSKTEYRLSMELISNAQAGNYSGCDEAVNKLLYLDRINKGMIQEEAKEREFITRELLQEVKNSYSTSLGFGVGEGYQTLSSTAAEATRKNVLKSQLNETEVVRNELQFVIQAYVDRMTPEKGTEYITDCIDKIGDYRKVIKKDAYETYANSSVDSHLEWLSNILKNLQDLMGGSALDDLRLQKSDLQTELLSVLDNNRLDEAKRIENQIEAVDKEIDETEKYLNSVLNSASSSESAKALAAAQLGSGSTTAALQTMKDEAVDSIKNGNLNGVGNILEGIGALASAQPDEAMGTLEDIYQELANQELIGEKSSQLDELMSQVEGIATDQIGNLSDDLSEEELIALMLAFFNGLMDGSLEDIVNSLTDEELVVMLAGLSMYAEETNGKAAAELLKICSRAAYNNGNKYIYEQLKNELSEFVPTDKMARIISYRYIFNDSQMAVTLQRGSQYYQFEAFSLSARKGNDIEEMSAAAGFQSVIYIPEDTAQEYFGVMAEYLQKTSYGVMLTEEINNRALEFFDYLLEAGGGV